MFVTSPAAAAVLANEFGHGLSRSLPTVYVLGSRAKTLLENCGIAVEYIDSANTADELLAGLGESEFSGKTILFLSGDRSLRTIPDRLGRIAEVEEAVVYETIEAPIADTEILDRIQRGQIGWMCFFSPSAVESYVSRGLPIVSNKSRVAVIGETTGQKARSLGLSVEFVSDRASAVVFANGLVTHIKNIE
jgi:uroporphyrinogen-III synthase